MILRCKTYNNDPKLLPFRAYDYALGYDIKCPYDIEIWDWQSEWCYHYIDINTHLRIEFDLDFGALLFPRSGLNFKEDIFLIPQGIDSDYRGSIKVRLLSLKGPKAIKKYERIAQLIPQRAYSVQFELTDDELNNTKRGSKGFGSSDKENNTCK